MKPLFTAATTLAAIALLALPARAQSPADSTAPNSLRKGVYSLSFNGPFTGEGTGEAGIWKMVDERTNVGLTVGLQFGQGTIERDGDEVDSDGRSLKLGLAVRRYANPLARVTPFVTGTVFAFGQDTEVETENNTFTLQQYGVGAGAGLGVEWFPVRQVSISGNTGLSFAYSRNETENEGSEETAKGRGFGIGTYTTGISLQIYF